MSYLLREYYKLCPNGICEDFLTESEKMRVKKNGEIYLTGVIQSANKKNGNGRIYSKPILEREIENYKKIISERRALGECDHPSCHRPSAKIMTTEGWKYIKDISNDEKVFTLNPTTNEIEVQQITQKIEQHYKGDMYYFKNLNLNVMVTPNHRFFLINRKTKQKKFATAKEIYDNRREFYGWDIPKIGNWNVNDDEYFEVPNFNDENNILKNYTKEKRIKYSKPLKIKTKVWMGFVGLFLAEGCITGNNISIAQNEGPKAEKIRNLLKQFPEEINWKEKDRVNDFGNTTVNFWCNDLRMKQYLLPLGKSYEKYIPEELKNKSSENLEELLFWFHLGDGRTRKTRNSTMKEVFTTSHKLFCDLNEVLLKTGASGNVTIREPKDRYIGKRLIKKENQRKLYLLHLSTTHGISLSSSTYVGKKENYDGMVYCVSVPNETFYCSDQNKAHWSGNSSIIELKNVSHVVEDVWWEGDDVYGKLRVLQQLPMGKVLAGLINEGIQTGISSRGLGSVREKEDYILVEDDYQLICFDIVQEPSTSGAFLMKEMKEHGNSYEQINEHFLLKKDRINMILNDILME